MIDSRYFYRITTHKQMFLLIMNSSWRSVPIVASAVSLLLALSTAALADNHQGGDSSETSGASGLPASNLGDWYLDGELKAAIFIDTVHNDPTIRASRTEVFGDDGSNLQEQGSDNSKIPTKLDDDGNIATSRPLATDTPEFGGTITGSRLAIGNRGANHNVLIEGGFFSNDSPYTPQLHRLWAEYGTVGIGLGWSTFMDFKGYNYPRTFDYTGPVGAAYARQIALRFRLSDNWYFGLEEPQDSAYLGFNFDSSHNEDSVYNKRQIQTTDVNDVTRIYEVDNKLRTRHFLPNLIFTYYGQGNRDGKHINFFSSILLQRVELDDNSPLFLESDEGLTRLIEDTRAIDGNDAITAVERELQLNDDLSGGLGAYNTALHLGVNGAMRRGSNNKFNLAYIYNGGRYLRDNPNPAHIVVSKDIKCNSSCDYKLVNIISHSYLMDFTFREKIGLIFSGTVTDNEYGTRLGGAATKQVHGTYLNFYQEVSKGLNSVYELGYSYRQAFNTRSNSEYPRLRFSYGISYSF